MLFGAIILVLAMVSSVAVGRAHHHAFYVKDLSVREIAHAALMQTTGYPVLELRRLSFFPSPTFLYRIRPLSVW
jgi:hypothetical protein